MAAPMVEKVHVEFDSSDSDSDVLDEHSNLSDEEGNDEGAGVENSESPAGKTGLADVFAKILHKNVPPHKQVILAKGKTDKELQKRKLDKAEEEDNKKVKVKVETKVKTEPGTVKTDIFIAREEKAKLWENMCRVKPDPLDRAKERQLQKIATRGVVQLFNAVRKQQKVVEEEIQQVGSSERKKDKVMEGMTKDKFLSILKGTGNTNVKSEKNNNNKLPVKRVKTEKTSSESDSDEDMPAGKGDKQWDILRDDFMMGAKMKDWDKEDGDDGESDDLGPGDPDLSDSD